MAKVVLSKAEGYSTEDINSSVEKSLDALDLDIVFNCESVVIKPNLCYYWDYSTGQTTDPRVVSSIVDWIRKKAKKKVSICVAEADASAMRTRHAFKMLGYKKMAREKNLELVNLSKGEILKKEVIVQGEKLVLPVHKLLLDSDLIINVPALKTHRTMGFSCALKNMFGAIAKPRKYSYHNMLAQTIVAINKIVASDIVVVDGIIAAGKVPKKMGIIITGDDALATDLIAADIVGHRPSKVSYLKLAKKEGIGSNPTPNIIELSTRLADLKKEFPKTNYVIENFLWRLQLKLLKYYAKIVGDVIPPVLEGV